VEKHDNEEPTVRGEEEQEKAKEIGEGEEPGINDNDSSRTPNHTPLPNSIITAHSPISNEHANGSQHPPTPTANPRPLNHASMAPKSTQIPYKPDHHHEYNNGNTSHDNNVNHEDRTRAEWETEAEESDKEHGHKQPNYEAEAEEYQDAKPKCKEARTNQGGYRDEVHRLGELKHGDKVHELNELKYTPNNGENEPQGLRYMEMENQAHTHPSNPNTMTMTTCMDLHLPALVSLNPTPRSTSSNPPPPRILGK
jgi:hypothetical protein